MLKKLTVENFTVFDHAEFEFGMLNVIHGENGTGKTHVLKLAYTAWATLHPDRTTAAADRPTKDWLEVELARKLKGVFRPDEVGRLASRTQGTKSAKVVANFGNESGGISFSFHTTAKSRVAVEKLPREWRTDDATYLPTREALSIFPGFAALYKDHDVAVDETWFDLCQRLDTRRSRGQPTKNVQDLVHPLEEAIGGKLLLDADRFMLKTAAGNMEIDLIAEGHRKLGTLVWLVVNQKIRKGDGVFWDEPEANLNPALLKAAAKAIVLLAQAGVQVFIATHSLFLMRELHILLARHTAPPETRYFGLHRGPAGVVVQQGPTIEDAGDIAALDENLAQGERYMALD